MNRSRRSKRGVLLEGMVRDMAHDGSAVVATDEGVVLTRGGLPGERILLETKERRRGVRRGVLRRVLSASPARTEPCCSELTRCGGCGWGQMRLETQREVKRRWVADAVGWPAESISVCAGSGLHYRRRVRWAWQKGRGQTDIGYRQARSRTVAPISECPVLEPALERTLSLLRENVSTHLEGNGEIEALLGVEGAGVLFRTNDAQPPSFYSQCEMLSQGALAGVVVQIQDVSPAIYGARSLTLQVARGGETLSLDASIGGFAQGNSELNDSLVDTVLQAVPKGAKRVVDLFAGNGNISVGLALVGPEELWINESDDHALTQCVRNVRRALGDRATKLNAIGGRAAEAIDKIPKGVDVVVLDPPREGASVELMRKVAAKKPAAIVYVSCNPATLGRDLAALDAFDVATATMLDMFPQTPHVEAVVSLKPKAG